jgi:hypothetical protein
MNQLMHVDEKEKAQKATIYLTGKTLWQLRKYKFFGPCHPNKKTTSYDGANTFFQLLFGQISKK